ncbi:Putative E3 ubiquitin-protein ligase LIN-1 [Apostasia shenzhenica]|uniref:RING-type E3 ubiquitin transferase n=1 Tax=Apostasia shenzhenica TaxID=1088818 RepID=A0A2I0BFC6_9ASPA|nr:Putative E3 ubiquitin-protein ligase LIN-1 [Apostasia shenzhenica]
MPRKQRVPMETNDVARFLNSTIGSFLQDRLLDRDRRLRHKEDCAERLAAAAAGEREVGYADQAVLANLDWGIDALEEAIATSNQEAKLARLDHAERMLRVCAMLDPAGSTAGVPNSYLCAWAHLHLACLSRLRSSRAAALHALDMFEVEPFFARTDFAPELWEAMFLPHMASIVGWYTETRHRIVMDAIPDAADLSITTGDLGEQLFNESLVAAVRPDQAEKLRQVEVEYGASLDRSTRMYAKYYKEILSHEPPETHGGSAGVRKGMPPLPPITEPPVTPRSEVSRSIPDFVKFGPILPKNAGFMLGGRDAGSRAGSGSNRPGLVAYSSPGYNSVDKQIIKDDLFEENDNNYDIDYGAVNVNFDLTTQKIKSPERTLKAGKGSIDRVKSPIKDQSVPAKGSSVDSPRTPRVPFPKSVALPKKETEQFVHSTSGKTTNSAHKNISSGDPLKAISPKISPGKHQRNPEQGRVQISSQSTPLSASPGYRNGFGNISDGSDVDDDMEIQRSSPGINSHVSSASLLSESEETIYMSSYSPVEKVMRRTKSPKDFVCPITGHLFNDPVTLETGQTYERRAIQEWLKRGNTTCPITRQPLSSSILPKTNYVLKRLITSWIEQNPDIAQEFSYMETPVASPSRAYTKQDSLHSMNTVDIGSPASLTRPTVTKNEKRSKRFMRPLSTSPTSVISQAASETVMNSLKTYASCLCTSEELQECEAAVLKIAKIWKESKADSGIQSYLSSPTILNGYIEILSASTNREALRLSVYVLSELVIADESVAETLNNVDSDFDCLTALLINGLAEASILIYQLRPSFSQLSSHDLVQSLVQIIMSKGEHVDEFSFAMEAKDAAIGLLEQILSGGDENARSMNALGVISANGLPALIKCLEQVEGRSSIISILVSCMNADRRCRNLIARRADLAPVLELFHAGNDNIRSLCIDFITGIVSLKRRTFCNHILQIIKDEGAFSTMHSFLVYLQMAPIEQQPAVASLLLQLDLLVEPRKTSIYRDEAIDSIIEAVKRNDFPLCQIMALETLCSLSGRLNSSGEPLTEAWLLKAAGVDQPNNTLEDEEGPGISIEAWEANMEEEEKVANIWGKRVAFVLCNHENGAIFKALQECLMSNCMEMNKACIVVVTWLTYMLNNLPDTGMREIASQCFLDHFVDILQSSRNMEEKVLATLALKSLFRDPDLERGLAAYARRIYKPLRKLKRCSVLVAETLKEIMKLPSVDATEFWSCTELYEIDSSLNGEVLSLVPSKGRLFSSHSDGTIKVWDIGKRGWQLVQEVQEHLKAVTGLYISKSSDRLYSCSLDKTIRAWTTEPEIHSLQVYDMKEPVYCLTANADIVCFSSQGTGAKVSTWSGVPKQVNFNKNVKCLAMTDANLYCGCTGYSIQEVDLQKYTSNTLYSGTRKLLGKQNIHALCIQDDILFAGWSSVDGIAGKAFSLSTKIATGSFVTALDIYCITVSDDFVFTGTKSGIIEIWIKDRLARVGSIKVGSAGNAKVSSLASDSEGEMLFSASSDGKIQVWALE